MANPYETFYPNLMGPPQRFGPIPTLPNQQIRPSPQGQGQGSPVDALTAHLQANPGLYWTLAAGMLGGRQALPQALANVPGAMKLDSESARRKRQEAATQKWLASQEAMAPATAELLQSADPSDVMNYAIKAQQPGAANEYGLNPIWGQDDQGNYIPVQASKAGGARTMAPPPGVSKFIPPGDLASMKSAGAAAGKGEGEALAKYRSMTSKLPKLKEVVAQLDILADKAAYTMGGKALDFTRRQIGMEPRDAAVARVEYIAMVDNQVLPLLRDTFGAQFTVTEGETLRATLGAPDMAPAEKKAILKAFIEQKVRDIDALALESMQGGAARPATDDGWNDMGGGVRIREIR